VPKSGVQPHHHHRASTGRKKNNWGTRGISFNQSMRRTENTTVPCKNRGGKGNGPTDNGHTKVPNRCVRLSRAWPKRTSNSKCNVELQSSRVLKGGTFPPGGSSYLAGSDGGCRTAGRNSPKRTGGRKSKGGAGEKGEPDKRARARKGYGLCITRSRPKRKRGCPEPGRKADERPYAGSGSQSTNRPDNLLQLWGGRPTRGNCPKE